MAIEWLLLGVVVLALMALTFGESAGGPPAAQDERYRRFVAAMVDRLAEQQRAHLGGEESAARFITVSSSPCRAWTSVGTWEGTQYQLIPVPAEAVEMAPTACDFALWPVLDELTRQSGDKRYLELRRQMSAAFVRLGFDPASGLLHVGSMSRFDVIKQGPVGISIWGDPCYKPGGEPDLDLLWAEAPRQMSRFCKSTYYGLVTRPKTMDFNRYVQLGWDDAARQHVQKFAPNHRGFLYTGTRLALYWVMQHMRTGDQETLQWAAQMAAKLQATQHPETGLLPHFFGSIRHGQTEQDPTPYANISDSISGLVLLQAAQALRDPSVAWDEQAAAPQQRRDLAQQLETMGSRLLVGLARYGYDPGQQLFAAWITLDGTPWRGETYYTFRTQEDKDAAVARDPRVTVVDVFPGYGFFQSMATNMTAGLSIVADLAQGAQLSGDPELLAHAQRLSSAALQAARELTGPHNASGQLTYAGTGIYLRAMLSLYERTGAKQWLEAAQELADRDLLWLAQEPAIDGQVWWRLPARSGYLATLLQLAAALDRQGRRPDSSEIA